MLETESSVLSTPGSAQAPHDPGAPDHTTGAPVLATVPWKTVPAAPGTVCDNGILAKMYSLQLQVFLVTFC